MANNEVSSLSDDVVQEIVTAHPDLAGVDRKEIEKIFHSFIALNFPTNNNGQNFIHVVPHADREPEIVFGVNGLKQLLISTGLFQRIGFRIVFAENIVKLDKLTGSQFNWEQPVNPQSKPIGIVAYIKLLNGYEEQLFFNTGDLGSHFCSKEKENANIINKRNNNFIWDFTSKIVLRELVKQVLPFNTEIAKLLSCDNQNAAFILDKFKQEQDEQVKNLPESVGANGGDTSQTETPTPNKSEKHDKTANKNDTSATPADEKVDSAKKHNSVTTSTPNTPVVTDKTPKHDIKNTPESNPNLRAATVMSGKSGWKIVCQSV